MKGMECNERNGMEWNVTKGKSKQVKNRYYRYNIITANED